jgi:hypothetical protein
MVIGPKVAKPEISAKWDIHESGPATISFLRVALLYWTLVASQARRRCKSAGLSGSR